ncbi:MAG: response regulator transcription factor [Phenylobacterium sp.]
MSLRFSSPRVLLVGLADPARSALADHLAQSGVEVLIAGDAPAIDLALAQAPLNVVVLDMDALGAQGLAACRRLSTHERLRIIAMSRNADETEAVIALESGADEYVLKSQSPRELTARIRALLRRTAGVPSGPAVAYEFQGFNWEPVRRVLRAPSGDGVPLSPAEASLLTVLVQGRGGALSRQEILAQLRIDGVEVLDRAVDTQVSRLRRKLARHGGQGIISTIYGSGYQWTGGRVLTRPLEDALSASPHWSDRSAA